MLAMDGSLNRKKEKPKLFLDMDGVMCDFIGFTLERIGMSSYEEDPKEFWNRASMIPNLFLQLPKLKHSRILYRHCVENFDVTMLTAAPKPTGLLHSAKTDKVEWMVRNMFDIAHSPVIVVDSWRHKKRFMTEPGLILVDDMLRNCEDWRSIGGYAIQHTDVHVTIKMLERLKLESYNTTL